MSAAVFDWDAIEALPKPPRVKVGKAAKGDDSERVIQRQIIEAFRGMGLRCIHIPNGVKYVGDGLARARQAAVLRADGLVAGFPDLLVLRPHGGCAFIEVKRPGGELKPNQIACRDSLQRDGFRYAAVCGIDGALDALREWGWL